MSVLPLPSADGTSTAPSSFADVAERLPRLMDLALAAVKNPVSNPVAALLTVGVVGLLGLLAVAIIALLVISIRGRAAGYEALALTPAEIRQRTVRRRITLIVLFVVSTVVVSAGWSYGTSDAACSRCHVIKKSVTSHKTSTHSQVECRACHVGPGVRSAYVAAVEGGGNLARAVTRRPPAASGAPSVRNAACLQCHEGVQTGTVTARAIRMRHSDVLEVGYRCTDCHNTVGHGDAIKRPRYPNMAQCVLCHDGTKASSACSLCHARDIGTAVRSPAEGFGKVPMEPDGCRGCHSMKPCIDCHGLELPHSDQFISGFHARPALLEPEMCMKCHDSKVCEPCHIGFRYTEAGIPVNPHAQSQAEFVNWHKKASGNGAGACACHDNDRERFCNYCHGKQPSR